MKLRIWIAMMLATIAIAVFFTINRAGDIEDDYGRKINPLRVQVQVPIIEDAMNRVYTLDSFVASHWESVRPASEGGAVLHYSKNVTPIDALKKIEEKDLFKKSAGGNHYAELYIKSTIYDLKRSSREGLLTIGENGRTLDLDEMGIDSVAASWGLYYLVRDQQMLSK